MFDEVGYLGAHVDDVVARAGTSHGTFYTYFASKRDVFQAVAQSLADQVLGSPYEHEGPLPRTVYERIARTNHRYFDSYRRHVRLMDLLEQMAMLDDGTREARRIIRHEFVGRSARFVERLQRDGQAYDDLDAWAVANSLCAMVDRVAYVWFVLGETAGFDDTVHTVSTLWVRALGVDPDTPLPAAFQPVGDTADA